MSSSLSPWKLMDPHNSRRRHHACESANNQISKSHHWFTACNAAMLLHYKASSSTEAVITCESSTLVMVPRGVRAFSAETVGDTLACNKKPENMSPSWQNGE